MRSLKDIELITPVLIDADYPDGAIINETVSQEGTAVINEVYNDYIANFLALVRAVGDTTNGVPDNESTTYQLLAAIQKIQNILTGVQQPLSLTLGVFSIPIKIDYLLDKTVLFVKANQAGAAGVTYQFKGSGALMYDFVAPNGFAVGDTVLLIINQPTNPVLAYSLTNPVASSGSITLPASSILGSDPYFYLPLSATAVPQYPKYLTMYIKDGDPDMQTKMVAPQYIADTRIITGMPNPAPAPDGWPDVEIILYYA